MHDDTSAFLANIENEKLRARIQSLACLDRCDLATVFPKTRAMGAAGDVKKRIVMLRSVEPRLDRLLYPGERIELVTKGTINAFAEQYFMGIWSIIINRTLILCTNFRIILLSSDNKGRARALMWQIPYDRLKKYGRSMGNITFKCVGGTFLRFVSVPAIDRKRLKQYLADRIDHARAAGPQFPSHADRDPLCPMCATPQPKAATACAESPRHSSTPPTQPSCPSSSPASAISTSATPRWASWSSSASRSSSSAWAPTSSPRAPPPSPNPPSSSSSPTSSTPP